MTDAKLWKEVGLKLLLGSIYSADAPRMPRGALNPRNSFGVRLEGWQVRKGRTLAASACGEAGITTDQLETWATTPGDLTDGCPLPSYIEMTLKQALINSLQLERKSDRVEPVPVEKTQFTDLNTGKTETTTKEQNMFYSLKEAAAKLGFAPDTVRRWVRDGDGVIGQSAVLLGKRYVIPRKVIDELEEGS